MEQPALLEMRNITKEFPGVKALDGVSLTVRPGTVHALMGENGAGKSTLMKCLFGIYAKNAGTIVLDGKEVDFKSSKEALENGVAMVHQELNQALTRSVMDNLWLGRYPKVAGLMVSESVMRKRTREIFEELDVHVDPKAIMSTLPVSQRQMVEIAKAEDKGVCQSPGYPTTWISFGEGNFPAHAAEVIGEAVGEATRKGYLRPSIVDPLTRVNPGDNTGKGVPNIEYQFHPGQKYVDFIISFKGCGAELGNAMKIMTTATLGLDKDFQGLKRFVLETALNAGGKPCPPFGIGIGIGKR